MKGLIVKSDVAGEKDTMKVAIPDNVVNVMINITESKDAHWNVGGMKFPEENHLTWRAGALGLGDEIEVEFAEIDEADSHESHMSFSSIKESMATAMANINDDAEVWQHKFERYHRLKAILESENLIAKEEEWAEGYFLDIC